MDLLGLNLDVTIQTDKLAIEAGDWATTLTALHRQLKTASRASPISAPRGKYNTLHFPQH